MTAEVADFVIPEDEIKSLLVRHEELRLKPYTDTRGKTTIGVGRNLTDVGISRDEALLMLEHDIDAATVKARKFVWFDYLKPARQAVILCMIFNVGSIDEFKRLIAAIDRGDFDAAANEMLASHWAGQVGARAVELSELMKSGEFRRLS